MTPRELALDVLIKCETKGQYSNLALDAALQRVSLSEADRGLATTLVYGVLEKRRTLDHALSGLSDRPISEIDPRLQALLRMGLYQLAYLDRIPDHAAVNETVSLAGKRVGGFVNAILRAFIRQGKRIDLPREEEAGVATALSVRHSVGLALCETLLSSLGEEATRQYLASLEKKPPLTLRVNTIKTNRESLLSALQEAGYTAEPTRFSKQGLRVLSSAPIPSLPGFAEGWFFVQDEASQLCVAALEARPGMTVIDTCACPGSKSFGIAIEMKNTGSIHSCDLHANKLSLVQSGGARLGISILETEARDARQPNPAWVEMADRVLCDVPCSGFGVFAKKPELRYKDVEKCKGLPKIQRDILETACRYVKEGGLLVYSTCTLLPEENEENIHAFLAAHSEFSCLRMRTLTPDVDETDGFFFAVLQKATKQ